MLTLDGYAAKNLLQATRMAEVWSGVREADGLAVILKHYVGSNEAEIGVERELEILRRVAGPGIPEVIEVGEAADGGRVIVQAQKPGVHLETWSRAGRASVADWLQVALELACILGRVHQHRYVHRDVHPRNVLVDPQTLEVHLVDLGAAYHLGANVRSQQLCSLSSETIGVLAFLPPEQTGRMNRGVDFRSDLYALGATLYAALVGEPPFSSTDPLALIHAHMARRPPPASERRTDVPLVLSRILTKLLEKEPDERYQSAEGLVRDLRVCAEHLSATGGIPDEWVLGRFDAAARPRFSARLFGRETELQALESAYTRACEEGQLGIALVRGPTGSGKSALVRQLRTVVAKARGYLATSQGEPVRPSTPYAAWSDVIGAWIDQVLVERDERLDFWRTRLRTSMQNVAAALLPLVPSLEAVVGPLAPVPPLSLKETRERLAYCVRCFLRAAATQEHPLILVLEDLHCADPESLSLLEALVSGEERVPMLIVGTFRGDVLNESRELAAVRAARARNPFAVELELGPISQEGVEAMLQEALSMPPAQTKLFAEHVEARAGRDLLSIQHYVHYMHEKGWLEYADEGWVWDESPGSLSDAPDSIITFLVSQLKHLPDEERRTIELASYAGDEFDVDLLSQLGNLRRDELEPPLVELTQRGVLATSRGGFRFTHGRIRDAARAILEPDHRARVHTQMVNHLLETLSSEECEKRIFELADHANLSTLAEMPSEWMRAVELNRAAGQRAMAAGAPSTAQSYLERACDLLIRKDAGERLRLAFELAVECGEAAVQAADPESARRALSRIQDGELSPPDFSRVARLRLEVMRSGDSLEEYARFVRDALARLGVHWPLHPGPLRLLRAICGARWALRGLRPSALPGPDPSPEQRRPVWELLSASGGTLARANIELLLLATCWMVSTTVRHGYSRDPREGVAVYASFISRPLWGARYADHLAKLVLEWRPPGGNPRVQARSQVVVWGVLRPFVGPRRVVAGPLSAAAETLWEHGDPELAFYSIIIRTLMQVFSGIPLAEAQEAVREMTQAGRQARHSGSESEVLTRVLAMLQDVDDTSPPATSPAFDAWIADIDLQMDRSPDNDQCSVRTAAMMVLSVLERFDLVMAQSARLWPAMLKEEPYAWTVDHVFYRGVSSVALAEERTGPERARLLRQAKRCCKLLRRWGEEGPDFLHMHQILSAELAWERGSVQKATALYRRGVRRAAQQDHGHHAAFALDRLGQRMARAGRRTEAAVAYREARDRYQAWGATVRCQELERRIRSR